MDQRHIEDFKSLDSMNSDLSETSRRHGARNQHTNPNGRFNPAFGNDEDMMEMTAMDGTQQPSSHHDDDVMMTDMTYANGSQPLRGDDDESVGSKDDDAASIASTDTYRSGTSMSSEMQQDLRESLPSHLFREIRALPSAKSRRRIMNETPEGSVSHRQRRSVRHGLDETDFTAMADEDVVNPQDEIRHMATSLNRKKTVRYM